MSEFKEVKLLTFDLSFSSLGLITSENNLSKVLRYSGNTFHRLFQHSTQPQLDKLKNFIKEFYKLNVFVVGSEISLYTDILYLTKMAYVILVHILYLLTSILGFNVIQFLYIVSVKANLIEFMAKIVKMLVESSIELHALMNILINEFCVIINYIFAIIEAKLLFYLILVEKQISIDYNQLYPDLESFELLLSELQSEVLKYIEILDNSKKLIKELKEIITYNLKLMNFINRIRHSEKIIMQLYVTFSHQNHKISKTLDLLSSVKLEKSINSKVDSRILFSSLKKDLEKLSKHSSDIINIKIVPLLITKLLKCLESIQKLLKMTILYDLSVSKEIISTIKQLLKVETINLVKLNLRIYQIQLKYLDILIRINPLLYTIEFHKEITTEISKLFGLMKFESSDVREFLVSCFSLEKSCVCISDKIEECIKKLLEACKNNERCGARKELIELYSKIIDIIGWLKFYVDLMMLEILIFKTIILTLIEMTVSSAILDGLMLYIHSISNIDSAIKTLMSSYLYLKTFYLIQLQNTMIIFALSSKLKFSKFIHGYYNVLVINLYWINQLIWVIECYIQHLIVFKQVATSLNKIISDIGGSLQILVQIYKVIGSMATITDKLKLVNNSINELNTIQEDMDITNWKQSAKKIRQETQSISRDIGEINSEIKKINKNADEIIKSLTTLISLEYFLKILIVQVIVFIKITNNRYSVAMGMGNQYYAGVILSVLGPCNKQLMFIFLYLVDMWLNLVKLIRFVETTIALIIVKMGFLYGLTSKLKDHVNKIDRGVVAVECAIEGVGKNLIECYLESISNHIIKIQDINQNINIINNIIKIQNLNDNLINNMISHPQIQKHKHYHTPNQQPTDNDLKRFITTHTVTITRSIPMTNIGMSITSSKTLISSYIVFVVCVISPISCFHICYTINCSRITTNTVWITIRAYEVIFD